MGSIFIASHPATKGSSVSFMGANGKMVHKADCKGLHGWQRQIAAAVECVVKTPSTQPVRLDLEFRFHRPKAHFINGDGQRLKPDATATHTSKPDVDKLIRAVLDGLTGALYADDNQVVSVNAEKVYLPTRDDDEGCLITWTFVGEAPNRFAHPAPPKPAAAESSFTTRQQAKIAKLMEQIAEAVPDWPEDRVRYAALYNLGLLPKGNT